MQKRPIAKRSALITEELRKKAHNKNLSSVNQAFTLEELEKEGPSVTSRLDAEAALRKIGVHVIGRGSGEIMLLAAREGFITIIKQLESSTTPITYTNSFNDSLMHSAAKGGKIKVIHYLLMRGVEPNCQNKFNETPLFLAAEEGHIDIVQVLCKDKRTNFEHIDKFGDTALHFAARNGHMDVCDFLLKKSKKLCEITNQAGKTALNYAIDNGQSSVANCIRQFGGQVATLDPQTCLINLTNELISQAPNYKESLFKYKHIPMFKLPNTTLKKKIKEDD